VRAGDALTVLSQQRQLWDVVLMIDVLEHFTKDEFVNILHNVKTALKPGGKFVARIPNMDSYAGSTLANGDFTHETLLNASSAMQVFLACGFMNVMVHPSTLQTESALKEFIRKLLWPILKFRLKVELFANGLSTKNALFTPNMIIVAQA